MLNQMKTLCLPNLDLYGRINLMFLWSTKKFPFPGRTLGNKCSPDTACLKIILTKLEHLLCVMYTFSQLYL